MAAGIKKRSIKSDISNDNAQIPAKRARNSETPQPSASLAAAISSKRGRESAVNSMIVWIRHSPKNQIPLKDIPWITAKITDLFKDIKVRFFIYLIIC